MLSGEGRARRGRDANQLGALTKGGKQVDELSVESTYIYFRRNYGLLRVLSQYFWRSMFRLAQIVKRVTFVNTNITIADELGSATRETRILFKTRLGGKAIH